MRSFTEIYRSLKINLRFKNAIVWCDIWYAVHIEINIWHQILICKKYVLQPIYIVSKIENIPQIINFSKMKNKQRPFHFSEECMKGIHTTLIERQALSLPLLQFHMYSNYSDVG